MEIRQATERDSDRIREIAEQSFRASYALSPLDIEAIVELEFEHDPLVSRLDEDGRIIYVAEEEEIMGFSEGHIRNDETGEIRWLHVDPTSRGRGAGTELFERVLADLRERVVKDIQAVVLADNREGSEFFQKFDFETDEQIDREFGERSIKAELYRAENTTDDEDETYTVPDDEQITVEGEPRFLDPHESISGEEGELLFVFETDQREEHFGFYCTNCGSFTDSVDGLGTVICETCGNEHRPDEWDGSYL